MKSLAEQMNTSIPKHANQDNVSHFDRAAISEALSQRRLRNKGASLVAAVRIGLLGLFFGFAETAVAASVDAASAFMVFPVVAQTASFASEITVFNPHVGFDLFLDAEYVGGEGTSAVGLRSCGLVVVPSQQSVQFSVGSKCSLPAGNQFGMLRISDNGANGIPLPFHAYSRVANPQGIGFSIPAYPNAAVFGGDAEVIGLKRQSAAPGYQTNCFVGSRVDPFTSFAYVRIRLYSANNAQIGNTVERVLQPNEFVRYLDIFSAAGAPAGDYSNVRAHFETIQGTLIAFCTVQDNASFGADFRIAGATEGDITRQHWTSGGDAAWSFASYGQKAVFTLLLRMPDKLRCELMGSKFGYLELRVRDFFSGVVVGGGNDAWDTGVMSLTTSGIVTAEVSVREGVSPVYPIQYGLDCWSGNGHFQQIGITFLPDDF